MPSKKVSKNKFLLPYFICSLASLAYVYDFLIRILPSTISTEIMAQYHIDTASFGLLSAFYFLGYMLMQVPCGLLYDRYGPRELLTITTLIAALATFFFLATPSYYIASVARFFMGVGSAFAYIGALVLASRWLPLAYFPLVAGLIQLMGSVGAIIGEAPFAALVEQTSPYFMTSSIAIIGFILAISFWLFIQDFPKGMKKIYEKHALSVWERLKYVITFPQNWAIASYAFAIWAPISIFASLWSVPYLMQIYTLPASKAAALASFLWAGVALGGPIFAWASQRLLSRRIPLIIASLLGLISSLLILYIPNLPIFVMALLFIFYGAAGSSQAVTFGLIQDNNLPYHSGTASGFNNMAIVTGGFLIQPLVGWLLKSDLQKFVTFSPIAGMDGLNFRLALIVLPLSFLLSLFIVMIYVRETNCSITYAHQEEGKSG